MVDQLAEEECPIFYLYLVDCVDPMQVVTTLGSPSAVTSKCTPHSPWRKGRAVSSPHKGLSCACSTFGIN